MKPKAELSDGDDDEDEDDDDELVLWRQTTAPPSSDVSFSQPVILRSNKSIKTFSEELKNKIIPLTIVQLK